MHITLGQTVYTNDRQKIGTIDRILVNSVSSHVEQFVVHHGIFLDQDRIVSREAIDHVDEDGVHLTLDEDAAKQLPRFDHMFAVGEPAQEYVVGSIQNMVLFSLPDAMSSSFDVSKSSTESSAHTGEPHPDSDDDVVLGRGADVLGSDGRHVGYVREVDYEDDGALESVVVQSGLIRHHQVTIRSEQIAEINDEEILLNVPADSVNEPE